MNRAEQCASEDMFARKFMDTRRVRLSLFRWPQENGGPLAIVQYDFRDASPAGSCWSVGLLAHLVGWRKQAEFLLETTHHSSLQRIDLLDLTGDRVDDLVIESDSGGAGTASSSLQVFDLSHGRFEEILSTDSRMEYQTDDKFTQVLDTNQTLKEHGRKLCVTKTTFFESGEPFDPPRVTHPCYDRGFGVNTDITKDRNRLLSPLQ